jgi:hypothetical protein
LVYPHAEFRLLASPLYMPFAWAVILIQVGFIGFLFSRRHHMLTSYLFTFIIGALFIPAFEWLAKYASWWHYTDKAKIFAHTPYYIILGEGLICCVLPAIYKSEWLGKTAGQWIKGVLFGVWIFVSYYIAHLLVG